MFLALAVWACEFPRRFPLRKEFSGDFPSFWGRRRMAVAVRAAAAETSKDVLQSFVGGSSARTKKNICPVIASLGGWHPESSSHNPEVVGSNPAPATR